jgi:YD repeat-containing protein
VTTPKGYDIPLLVKYTPGYSLARGILGRGWSIPLLESKLVQSSESVFMTEQPDGWVRKFSRSQSDPNLLVDQGGWKGLVGSKEIILWAECGWKLIYRNGQLKRLETPQNEIISVEYQNGIPHALSVDGREILALEKEEPDQYRIDTARGSSLFQMAQGPVFSMVEGKVLVASVEPILGQISSMSGKTSFIYDLSTQGNPIFKYSKKEATASLEWDFATSRLKTDGTFEYRVNAGERDAPLTVVRKNKQGVEESIFADRGRGIARRVKNGLLIESHSFVGGVMKGKERTRTVSSADNAKILFTDTFVYDEKGVRLRTIREIDGVKYVFPRGTLMGTLDSMKFDDRRRIKDEILETGEQVHYEYPDEFSVNQLVKKKSGGWVQELFFEGRLASKKLPNGKSYRYFYDGLGRLKTITDNAGQTSEYVYGKKGDIVSEFKNKKLLWRLMQDVNTRQMQKVYYDDIGNIKEVYDPIAGVEFKAKEAIAKLTTLKNVD